MFAFKIARKSVAVAKTTVFCVYVCVYMCVYVCVYMCTYVYVLHVYVYCV